MNLRRISVVVGEKIRNEIIAEAKTQNLTVSSFMLKVWKERQAAKENLENEMSRMA